MTTTTISRSRQQRPAPHAAAAGARVFSLPLEHGPLAPATARRAARPILASWGLDENQLYDALLVISELVTNAVTHALPPVALHLHTTTNGPGRVQVHVSDGGPHTASPTTSWATTRPTDEHGRGTTIITTLAHHTGTTPNTNNDNDTNTDTDGLIDHWADLGAA
ncbi:ATP-binding protein [Streptomyces sp. NBC_00289]|uniref:ATP-binding protein n=1 Tax=Streptomyces sp. NBC_00289 TaxID=2975703 RepID=UPI0032475BDA